MRRTLALAAGLAALLAAGSALAAGPTADPGRQALSQFVRAAGAGNAAGLWALLSKPARTRLGPFARFKQGTAVELDEGVGSFARSPYRVVVSERVTDTFGVAALAGERRVEGTKEYGAYAVVLRLEGGAWRVELGGPVRIEPLGPNPGARAAVVQQVAAEVKGVRAGGDAVLWVDGRTAPAEVRGAGLSATIFANLPAKLARGRHTVVAFAGSGKDASAAAWTFSVR